MKPTLYLETTVVSYYTARLSRNIVARAHQRLTYSWWQQREGLFKIYVSPVVLEEAARGDRHQAARRLAVLAKYLVLVATPETERLTRLYMRELVLPERAVRDAAHLAFACGYDIEYLLTWNCAHLANAEVQAQLLRLNLSAGIATPCVCTPEQLMGMKGRGNVA